MNSESRSKKAIRNVLMGIISKIVIMILGFVDRKVFISILGEELLGVSGLFTNVLLVLSLAELGLTNVMVFSYYKPLAEKDYEKLRALTAFYKKIYNTIAITVAVIGAGLIPVLKYIINVEVPVKNLVMIYLIYLTNTVISYLFVYKSTIFTADQNGYIVTSTQIKFDVLRQISQILILTITRNFIAYLCIKVIFAFLNNLYLMYKVNKAYPFLDLKNADKLSTEEKKEIASTVKSGFVYKISSVLLNGTDNIIISSLIGTIWVGLVANYDTVLTSVSALIAIIFTSLTASIGNLNVTAAPEKKKEIFEIIFFAGCWISIIVIPCCFLLLEDMVHVWLGEKYILNKGILYTKLGMMYFTCTLNPIFSFREALGLFKKSKYFIFAGAFVNIVLSVFMGLKWGVTGVFLASLVAMSSTYVWYEPIILYRDYFDSPCRSYFIKHFYSIFSVIAVCFLGKHTVGLIAVNSWGKLFIKGIVCFLFVFLCSCILMCWRKEFKFIKEWINKIINKITLRRSV